MTADRRSSIENSIENTRKYEKEDGEAGERDRERERERDLLSDNLHKWLVRARGMLCVSA
jgi:hypothetical protein